MVTHRDRESLAEEWHQLLTRLDADHPQQAAVPIAADVDAFTVAYAILLLKEGAFDPQRGKLPDLTSAAVRLSSCDACGKGEKYRPFHVPLKASYPLTLETNGCHTLPFLQQLESRNCCSAAQGLNMSQLSALIGIATGRMRDTGRRPLSSNPRVR